MFLDRKIKELQQLKKEVPLQANKIALINKEKILDLVRVKQLEERGIDGKGKRLKPYTPFTVAIKKSKGEPTNRTTLLDTGDFHDAFDLFVTDQYSIGIFSRDVKSSKLVEKYGNDIFLLTVENNKILNEEIIFKNLMIWLLQTPTFTRL